MITLHHVEQTRSMRTLWLLHELEVPFEVSIHAFDKSLRDPGYLAISPAGRVPSLEIDGSVLDEIHMTRACSRQAPSRNTFAKGSAQTVWGGCRGHRIAWRGWCGSTLPRRYRSIVPR